MTGGAAVTNALVRDGVYGSGIVVAEGTGE